MYENTYTVSQINAYIKLAFDKDYLLHNIWVRGEISNFKLHFSGHMYLSLKDDSSLIRAVMFRGANSRLSFMPQNGMKILARGRISAYERDGQYQLYIEEMIPDGIGELYTAFENLKAKLADKGYFDEKNKKPIPDYPKCIGVITGDKSAALSDIINILGRRFPLAKVTVYPVQVQGDTAAREISGAVTYFNQNKISDVLIVARGGGSFEDLNAFNDEGLAKAIYNSEIPVISGVGHETDFTICDFVSDLRAPTPSAAAELATQKAAEAKSFVDSAQSLLINLLKTKYIKENERFLSLCGKLSANTMQSKIDDRRMTADALMSNLTTAYQKKIMLCGEKLKVSAAALDAMSPLKVLARGYAVAEKDGKIIKKAKTLKKGDRINLTFSDGKAECEVSRS